MCSGETQLWRRVVALKFGEEWGGWSSKLGRGVHGCWVWFMEKYPERLEGFLAKIFGLRYRWGIE